MTTLRELATGAGVCVLALDTAACKPPSTVVDPGMEPSPLPLAECPTPVIEAPKPPPGSPDDREPPRVIGAKFNGSDRVTLSFSEAVEAPATVNPRQFRLSHAYSSIDYAGNYASGRYYDLAFRYGYDIPIIVASIEQTDPDELVLTLSRGIPVSVCETLRMAAQDAAAAPDPNYKVRQGLFLHYTGRGSVGVRDLSHNPLGDFGGEWALEFGTRNKTGSGTPPVVRFDLLVELTCPSLDAFDGPPGPK